MKTSQAPWAQVRLLGWSPEESGRLALLVGGLGAVVEDPAAPAGEGEGGLQADLRGPGVRLVHGRECAEKCLDREEENPSPLIVVARSEEAAPLAGLLADRSDALMLTEPCEDAVLTAALRMGLQRERDRQEILALREEVRKRQAEVALGRREAESEARRRTQFLAAISHDLRTPLWEIDLVGQVVQSAAVDAVPMIDWGRLAEGLLDGVNALRERVDDLFDLAQLDLGTVEFRETRFLLAPFLDRILTPARREAGARNLTFVVLAEPPWATLRTDSEKLSRILLNLISNAMKFTAQGEVRVWARAHPTQGVTFVISDTGRGISETALGSIFDEFAQVHNPERDRSKGTGLGLAICRRLVERLGGTIEARSKPGRGSEFTVRFPPSIIFDDGSS